MVSNVFIDLTPAESMILRDPRTNSIELVKVTFLDLLNRKVIQIQTRAVMKGLIKKKERMENFVMKGDSFHEILKPHEEVFQKAFKKSDELPLKKYSQNLVKSLGKHGYSSRDPRGDFPKYKTNKLRNPMVEQGYLVQIKKGGFLKRSEYGTTEYGSEVREKLENILTEAGKLDEYVSTDPPKAKALINILGTHIFILKQYDAYKFKEFNKEISKVDSEDYRRLLLSIQRELTEDETSDSDDFSLDEVINIDFNVFDSMDIFIDAFEDISDSIDDASAEVGDNGVGD